MRSIGYGEGESTYAQTCGHAPSPGSLRRSDLSPHAGRGRSQRLAPRPLRYAERSRTTEAQHAEPDHQDPIQRGRRVRLLSGDARRRMARCRRWCWPARCTASTRTSATWPRSSPATASSRQRPTCSGAPCRARSATTTTAPQPRSQPRLEKIKTGERDMADVLTHLKTLAQFNGRAATMGFCYGGPYAILGPEAARLCGRHLLPRQPDAGLHQGARRRHRAGLHHLGRPGPPRAARGARCLPPGARPA